MAESAPELPSETRQRLLDVAGEVFAEHGFHHATIRDICRRAGVNIASVNYHFGDKRRLYATVLQDAQQCAVSRFPADGLDPTAPAPDRLHAFITAMLRRIFDSGRPSWHGKLMSREMIEPTEALPLLVEHGIRPQARLLETIVREIVGAAADDEDIAWGVASVVGQIVFYHHARPVLNELNPIHLNLEQNLDRLADHIAAFSLAGLKAMRGAKAHAIEGGAT